MGGGRGPRVGVGRDRARVSLGVGCWGRRGGEAIGSECQKMRVLDSQSDLRCGPQKQSKAYSAEMWEHVPLWRNKF